MAVMPEVEVVAFVWHVMLSAFLVHAQVCNDAKDALSKSVFLRDAMVEDWPVQLPLGKAEAVVVSYAPMGETDVK